MSHRSPEGPQVPENTDQKDQPQITPTLDSPNREGRGYHLRRVEEFEELPPKEQNEAIRTVWKSVAMGLAQRARQFSTSCSPRDFGKLYQLVQAGSVSLDKAFPPKAELQTPKLIVNLFASLGQRAARIAIPEVPVIECQPTPTSEPLPSTGSPGSNT